MRTFLRDLRSAARTLNRTRVVAVAAILTLALGIGATTTMFSAVYAAVLRPLPFDRPDRLAVLFITQKTTREGLVRLRWSWPRFVDLRNTLTSFESLASHSPVMAAISGGQGAPEPIDGEVVSPEYWRVLRVAPIAGRPFSEAESSVGTAQPVAMISSRLWRRRFGGELSVVGGTVRINDVPLTVVGILPENFAGLSGKADLWFPPTMAARLTYADYLTTPQFFLGVVGRLKNGVTIAQADAELRAIGSRFAPAPGPYAAPDSVWSATVLPIDAVRVDPVVRRSALVLLLAAACVLLIACVNVASLLLARARTRRREMAVRLAIGSTRGRLVRQLLTEGVLMAALAGAGGTMLALWGIAILARTVPAAIPTGRNNYLDIAALGGPAFDGNVLAFALTIALATTIVFALAPALSASRPDLAAALRENERGHAPRGRALSVLIVSEVALAVCLLAGSGWLLDGFARIQDRRTGYETERVITFWVRPPVSRYPVTQGPSVVERLLTRVQSVAGVESAAVNRCTPFNGCSGGALVLAERPIERENMISVGRHYVSGSYFETLRIPLVRGRTFSDADREGAPLVAVINESGARRFWPNEDPIGKRVRFVTNIGAFADRARSVEIVGVVGDVKYGSVDQIDDRRRADVYTSYLQFSFPDTMIIVKAKGVSTLLVPALREAIAAVDPALPIADVLTLDDRIDNAIAGPRFNTVLIASFAAAALLLAAIGVYGILSYSVSTRRREIGVRLALGADARRIVARVLGEGLRLAALGAAIGLGGAIAGARLMRGFDLYGLTSTTNPLLLAAVFVVMMGVAGLAAFLPARRAARVDPMIVLRQE